MIITKVELIMLAGGQSRRMGQDKTRLKIGSRTLWQHALTSARRFGLAVRVIRRDQLRGLGPMGGVLTALRTTRYDALIFLAADMPWVSWSTLRHLIREVSKIRPGLFTITGGGPGFPFALLTALLPRVENYIASGGRSLRDFASLFADSDYAPPPSQLRGLTNLNLPCQLDRERQRWKGIAQKNGRRGANELAEKVAPGRPCPAFVDATRQPARQGCRCATVLWEGAPFAIPVHAVKFLPRDPMPLTMKCHSRPLPNA